MKGNIMSGNKRFALKVASGAGGLVVAGSAFAVGPDLSTLTGAVDVGTVVTAILAVAVILLMPQITKYAVSSIRRMFPK